MILGNKNGVDIARDNDGHVVQVDYSCDAQKARSQKCSFGDERSISVLGNASVQAFGPCVKVSALIRTPSGRFWWLYESVKQTSPRVDVGIQNIASRYR